MVNAVIAYGTDGDIGMTEPHWEATMALEIYVRKCLFQFRSQSEDSKVGDMIEQIHEISSSSRKSCRPNTWVNIDADGVERSICDYIACMTDRYALALFEEPSIRKPGSTSDAKGSPVRREVNGICFFRVNLLRK